MVYMREPKEEQPFFPLSVTDPNSALKGYKKEHPPSAGLSPVTRYFCSTCGTHLFNASAAHPVLTILPYVWDEESDSSPAVVYEPTLHTCFRDHALEPNDDKPKYPGFPPTQ